MSSQGSLSLGRPVQEGMCECGRLPQGGVLCTALAARAAGERGRGGEAGPQGPVRSAGIPVHLGEGMRDAGTFAIRCWYLHVTPGWQYIRPASCLDRSGARNGDLGVGAAVGLGGPDAAEDPWPETGKRAHSTCVGTSKQRQGRGVAPERWRPLGSEPGVGCR